MILEKIRHETKEIHAALESTPLLSIFSGGIITVEKYLVILGKFHSFIAPIETKIADYPVLKKYLNDFDERRKASWLESDLVSFSQKPLQFEKCETIPSITSGSHAFGALYVLEGSTLGGKLISKQLNDQLGIDKDNGARFFNAYGSDTGVRWKVFKNALETFAENDGKETEIIQGALSTFKGLHNWLSNL